MHSQIKRNSYDNSSDKPNSSTPQLQPANFLNLLIVDDERSIREACREVAQSLGFTTFVADSVEHAFRLLEAQGIDGVLLDLRLPGAGGLEALRRIKERRPEERQTILSAIAELNGDKLQAARLLGIGKTTLYRKLKDYAAQPQ